MTRDFLKPQKTTGLDTNAPVGKPSRFAPDPFPTRIQPKPQQPDLQTLIQRGLRLGDPMAKAWANTQPTVDSGSQPSVQAKHEQPDLQTLIQRGQRLGDPMAKAWANVQPTVQREAIPEEEKEENLQMKVDEAIQREEIEEEETLQTKSESTIQRQELEEDDETLQTKSESTLQREELEEEEESVQTKLTIGKPGDKYEQEADHVAAKVMAMPETAEEESLQQQTINSEEEKSIQTRPLAGFVTSIGESKLSSGGGSRTVLQNKDGKQTAKPSLERQLASQNGGGKSLPDETRSFMESRFGADFGDVRVHTDSQSVQMNKELGAQAFTHGNDVYFNSGKFNPGSSSGKELLAHELTHTIQQTGGKVQAKFISTKVNKGNKVQAKFVFPLQMKEAPAQEEVEKASSDTVDNLEKSQQAGNSEIPVAKEEKNQTSPQNQDSVAPEVNATVTTKNSTSPQEKGDEASQETADANAETSLNQEKKATDAGSGENPGNNQEATPPEAGSQGVNAVGGNQESTATVSETTTQETAPVTPDSDPDFQAVVSKAKGVANKEKQHAPAGTKAKQAQDAAQSPASEVESKAQGNQVGEMEQAPTPGFNAAAFKAKLMERIKEAAPKNLDEADNFKNNNKLGGVKSEMQDKVKQEQTASQTPLEEKTKQTPDTSGIEPKLVTPLPPNEAGAATQNIGAEKAVPKAKGQGKVEAPLQESSQKLDQQMAEADVTEEQLAKSNEPQFQAALGAKQEASANAKQAPQEYRKFEQNQLTQAKGETTATAEQKLQGMHGSRAKLLSQVTNQQVEAKGKDEQERAKVAGDLQKIYQDTKTKVETALNSLDSKVQQAFDSGAAEAQKAFEDYVEKEMEAYKDKRYSGLDGKGRWVRDLFLDLPSEVNVFYQKGRKLYLQKMDVVLDKVVNIIGDALTNAKAEIANGRNRIQQYVTQLPQNLKTVGQEAATDIQGQFDELEQSVDRKQDELINTLAQQYNEKLQAVDSRIEEMKAANQGLVSKATNAMTGVIDTINKLKDMLLSVLSKAAHVIGNIIKDPIGFLGNLVSGIKQGFENFVGNIGKHLQAGLIGWLTGTLGPMGIQLPDDIFSLPGIFSLVTQVLGVTFGQIRNKAVKRFGEPVVAGMEQSVEVFQVLRDRDAMGLWEQAQEQFSNLKETVIGEIKNMVITQVITAGVKWVLSLLNPASAFVKAAMAIYDIIMFFVNRGKQVLELVNAVVDAVAAIAKGAVGGAAKLVENALAKALPVVIGFLASIAGVGGLAKKVENIIGKVRKRIDRAIDKVLLKAKRLFKGKKGKGNKDGKFTQKDKDAGLAAFEKEEKPFVKDNKISHENASKVGGIVKRKHPVFKEISVVDGGDSWKYQYVFKATANTPSTKGEEENDPDYPRKSAPRIGEIKKHGQRKGGDSNRKEAKILHIESEHILPFAVGRTLWSIAADHIPGRKGREDRHQTTIMIYKGAADIKTRVDRKVINNFQNALNSLDLRKKVDIARTIHDAGDPPNARSYILKEVVGPIIEALETAKEDATSRTITAISEENTMIEEGFNETNGQRRAKPPQQEPPKPSADSVRSAAEAQYKDVFDLIEEQLMLES